MQTDIWLTEEISYPERCPLCSASLKKGSTTCFSCGFSKHPTGSSVWIDPAIYGYSLSSSQRHPPQSIQQRDMRDPRSFSQPTRQPNPVTPIPPRASAQPANAAPGSIVITKRRLPHIDEIDTTPVLNEDSANASSRALVPMTSQFGVTTSGGYGETTINVQSIDEDNPSSWTAGKGSQSSYARLISSRSKHKKSHNAISLNPIDRVRWWLLRPGRIEFVLWMGGTILLVGITCVLLLVTAFSFEWLTPGFISSSSTNMTGNSTGSQEQATVTANGKMILTRIDTGPLLPGQSIRLHGQGFSPHGRISFLFDGTQPLLDLNGKSNSTQADAHGIFTVTLRLNDNFPWHSESHVIVAQDLATKRIAKLAILLDQGPIGKGVSSTPVPSYPPVVTPTPTQGGSSGQPTPVGQTPVPITPTPYPGTPTVTPNVGKTIGLTPTTSPASTGNPILGNALDNPGASSLGKQLTRLSPWVWVMIACYSLSMVLLGLAGVLHKRHQ